MSDVIDGLKSLSLHGMASAWPEILGTARMKTLDHDVVLHQLGQAARHHHLQAAPPARHGRQRARRRAAKARGPREATVLLARLRRKR